MMLRLSSTALLLALTTSGLYAQTLVLEPAQQTIVREYVIAHPVQPVQPPPDFQIAVGAVIPDVVEITPLDAPDLGASYSYVVIDNQTVLVDPGTRKIVQIIQ
ncbi:MULTISPECIES: DUF1236 domain-containing protein [Hyphomicrobiales]|uniref:DUF1236 domain-containing protein n=1 Tax=Hyphomicrobiales TaxID=356 RepID=UPI000477E2C7|nr:MULTISPECIES: DUF1236 domain-containing protein [Phyllobacteriaceae]MCX8572045.1 DUF1236 domain-containing protein [Aminobacter sp. MET-1]